MLPEPCVESRCTFHRKNTARFQFPTKTYEVCQQQNFAHHSRFTALSLQVHSTFTALSLQVHWTFTAGSQHFRCRFTGLSLQVHCRLTALSLQVHCMVHGQILSEKPSPPHPQKKSGHGTWQNLSFLKNPGL